MKNKIIKIMSLMLVFVMALSLVGCGDKNGDGDSSSQGGGSSNRPAGQKIVIFAGGSSEFSWIAGSEEDKVIDYIEQKYFEETGTSLDFNISYLGEDMQTKLSNELAAGSQVDIVISHTRGGVGIDDKLKGRESHYNLYDSLDPDSVPNLYEAVQGSPLNALTTMNNDVIGIPSVISPYKFGILVRKDYMEQAGYTDDPGKVADGKILVDNLDDFAGMCRKMNEITGNEYAVTGAAWDLEKVVTLGAYADAGYFTKGLVVQDGKELIMDGGATKAYKDVLSLEYNWATTGVISKDANSILLEQAESDFISGKTGVFVQDPTIQHLIKVARSVKARDPEAEFTVLGPMVAHKGDTKKGFMRNTEATFAAAMTKKTKCIVEIMDFLNWVYESADNYNLCRYGIEGEHWIDNKDGTYSYPEGKEVYTTKPPYSGILTLVENQRMSNMIYKGYTEEELHWIKDIAGNEENYIKNDVVDYMFTSNEKFNTTHAAATENLYAMAVEAWTGQTDPSANFDKVTKAFNSAVFEIHNSWTEQYKAMKGMRS